VFLEHLDVCIRGFRDWSLLAYFYAVDWFDIFTRAKMGPFKGLANLAPRLFPLTQQGARTFGFGTRQKLENLLGGYWGNLPKKAPL